MSDVRVEEMLRQAGQDVTRAKPLLEVNPGHALVKKLKEIFEQDGTDPRLGTYAELLYGQALLAEGGQLEDPGA